jgi:hypothetical protein
LRDEHTGNEIFDKFDFLEIHGGGVSVWAKAGAGEGKQELWI